MMKKTYKSSLLALSVLASFTSCSESESLQQANLSKDKITFHATLDNSWKPMSPASSSRAAIAAATEKGPIVVPTPFGKPLYLHSVVQETADLQQAAATTRGVMQEGTTLGNTYYNNSFGVTAIYKDNGTNTALFANQKASKNNEDIWEIEDKTNSRWPFDALVSFHAYAPFYDATDGMWSVTTDAENVKTKIKYTAKSAENEIQSQPDIIVATNAESRSVSSDDKAVELKFSHALTAVNFAISKDLTEIFKTEATDGSKLKSIKLSGIPNEGICELTATEGNPQTPSQNWTLDTEADGKTKKTGTYTFDLTKEEIQIGESYALTSNKDKNILMMIPQKLNGTEAKLTFVLDIKGKGDQTFTFDLSNQTWLPGTSVTYKLSASAINHLENAEVKFPDSWKDTEQAKYSYPKTDFNEGESIGLYVVNSNNAIEGENLKCVKQVDGSWKIGDGNTKYLKLKNYKYFAYYPYNAIAPKVDARKDNANEFFGDKISSLSVVPDQSKEATLLAQDFQVAKGEIANDGSTLDFNMEHQVGLAVLNLTSKNVAETRQFKNDKYKYYYETGKEKPLASDYTDLNFSLVLASNNFEGTNKPCSVAVNKYLQIIPLNKSMQYKATEQEGVSSSAWGKLVTWTFTPTDNIPVAKNITVDADFKYLARLFNFTGNVETFKVPENATYTLQCWGAGSPNNSYGGGYTFGDTDKQKDDNLYVCVGEQGKVNNGVTGGAAAYNGGGAGGNAFNVFPGGCSGGGATHIGLKNSVLTGFANDYSSQLLLVAGGQGGRCDDVQGGYGGGTIAGIGQMRHQSGGYTTNNSSVQNWYIFGKGKTGRNGVVCVYGNGSEGNGGGGGGFYGGYSHDATGDNTNCSGGGGTGYVNDNYLIKKGGQTIAGNQTFDAPGGGKETGHQGNGAAQISWLPSQLTRVK